MQLVYAESSPRKEPLMPAKPQIIADPQTNRGTAFTIDERHMRHAPVPGCGIIYQA